MSIDALIKRNFPMTQFIAALVLTIVLQACSKAPEAAPPVIATVPTAIAWVKPAGADIDPIFARAKAANKPVFLYWGAVWCPPCNQIKAVVFKRQDFIALSQLFIPVYLDGDTPGAQKLGARFKVRGYPTMILLKPDGTELTRLPGEVDANQYMEVLNLGLTADKSVKDALATALGSAGGTLTPEAWRQLAFYSWDQDEAQLVPHKERAATLQRLAQACPASQPEAASRLALKAIVAYALDEVAQPDPSASLARVRQILNDAPLARKNFDALVNYGAQILPALTAAGSPERNALLAAWLATLDKFAIDASLSKADRLSAVAAKVMLVKAGQPKGVAPTLDALLLAQVRDAAATADRTTTNNYERQAVIPGAADLLSEAGLLAESDALLKAELPRAVSPYYHMLGLAANARARGDKLASLDWAERAWNESRGPATRLQWGSSYVSRLIELAPQDAARIEKAASGVLAELDAVPESFYERNRRGLEKMGQRLMAWNDRGQHAAVVKKLAIQLGATCTKLPPQDEARAACNGVFRPRPAETKA